MKRLALPLNAFYDCTNSLDIFFDGFVGPFAYFIVVAVSIMIFSLSIGALGCIFIGVVNIEAYFDVIITGFFPLVMV